MNQELKDRIIALLGGYQTELGYEVEKSEEDFGAQEELDKVTQTIERGVPMSFLDGPMDVWEAYAAAPYLFPPCFEPEVPEDTYYEVWVVEYFANGPDNCVLEQFHTSYSDAFELAQQVGGAVAMHVPGMPEAPPPGVG